MATRHEIFLTASPSVNQAREHLVRLSRLGGFASTEPVVIQTLKQNSTACRQAVAPGRDGGMAPVDFLSDEQVGAYGRFVGSSSELDLERFFFLDDDDRTIVGRRRGAANRLGFAVQLETVPNLGSFLDDPTAVPGNVVEFVSRQLGIAWPAVFEEYSVRPKTGNEHGWEITEGYGHRRTSDPVVLAEFTGFRAARTATRTERPTAVFDQAVAWLRREKALLPGLPLRGCRG